MTFKEMQTLALLYNLAPPDAKRKAVELLPELQEFDDLYSRKRYKLIVHSDGECIGGKDVFCSSSQLKEKMKDYEGWFHPTVVTVHAIEIPG